MGVPRFRPASIFENCRDFGRNPSARPGLAPHLQPGERAWAIYQRQVATAVLRELRRRDQEIVDLALELAADYDWLIRKLYGRVPADLGEMFEWTLRLGVPVLPAIDDAGNVRPLSV